MFGGWIGEQVSRGASAVKKGVSDIGTASRKAYGDVATLSTLGYYHPGNLGHATEDVFKVANVLTGGTLAPVLSAAGYGLSKLPRGGAPAASAPAVAPVLDSITSQQDSQRALMRLFAGTGRLSTVLSGGQGNNLG